MRIIHTSFIITTTGILGVLIFLSSLGLTASYGQLFSPQTISGFKLYQNPDYHISIQYPKNWQKSEDELPANTIVKFNAPDTKNIVGPASLLISTYQMSNDTTLDEFVDFFFKDRYNKPNDHKLVTSADTTLMNLPAKQFVLYDYDTDKILGTESTGKVMRVLAFDNYTGNGYAIKYWAEPSLFNKFLPAAEKMISTFRTTEGENDGSVSIVAPPIVNNLSSSKENLQSQMLVTKFIAKFGSPGTGEGQFHDPGDLAIDPLNGFVYVADLLNNRIQKFDTNGKYLSQWGSYGLGDGQFSHPGDVAISPWGEIFVADIDNARIERFSPNATFISKWGEFGIRNHSLITQEISHSNLKIKLSLWQILIIIESKNLIQMVHSSLNGGH